MKFILLLICTQMWICIRMIYHNSTGLMDYSSDNWLRNFDKAVTQWNPIKIGSRAKSRPINLFEFFGHLTADFFLEIIFVNLQNGSPCASFRHLRLCVDILRLLIKRGGEKLRHILCNKYNLQKKSTFSLAFSCKVCQLCVINSTWKDKWLVAQKR